MPWILFTLITHRANTNFNWVVPIMLTVWAGKRTGEVRAVEQAAGASTPS